MMRLRPSRPTPALVVAVIALTVALGGTGYAAITLPAKSVGEKQLKKRAVTNSKIRDNAVRASKVRDDSLSGRDILESTLSKVADAGHADVADSATSAGSANTANSASTAGSANTANTSKNADALQGHTAADFVSNGEYKQVLAKMQAGEERELVRNGPISIYARCATTSGDDELHMFAKTDVDGAIMLTSWGDTRDGTTANDFLDTTTAENDRAWDSTADDFTGAASASTPTGVTKIVDHYDDNHLIAPSGEAISWEGEAELLAFNYLNARCLIAGNVHLYKLSG